VTPRAWKGTPAFRKCAAAIGASKSVSASKPTRRVSASRLARPAAVVSGYRAVGLTVPPWVGTRAFASVCAPRYDGVAPSKVAIASRTVAIPTVR
jgi:hypothetical protein